MSTGSWLKKKSMSEKVNDILCNSSVKIYLAIKSLLLTWRRNWLFEENVHCDSLLCLLTFLAMAVQISGWDLCVLGTQWTMLLFRKSIPTQKTPIVIVMWTFVAFIWIPSTIRKKCLMCPPHLEQIGSIRINFSSNWGGGVNKNKNISYAHDWANKFSFAGYKYILFAHDCPMRE